MLVSIRRVRWGSLVAMNNTTGAVAKNIRKALDAEGYTAKNIAERLNISYSQATRLLNGKCRFRPEYIGTLSRMLGMDPERLIGVNPNKVTIKFTVKEAAERTKYHPDTIRKAVYRGEMKSVQRVKGGKYLIDEMDLTAWLAGAR